MAFKGGTTSDKWAKDPYIVIDIPNTGIPVYKVQKESERSDVKVLNIIFCYLSQLFLELVWLMMFCLTFLLINQGIHQGSIDTRKLFLFLNWNTVPRYIPPHRRARVSSERLLSTNVFGSNSFSSPSLWHIDKRDTSNSNTSSAFLYSRPSSRNLSLSDTLCCRSPSSSNTGLSEPSSATSPPWGLTWNRQAPNRYGEWVFNQHSVVCSYYDVEYFV